MNSFRANFHRSGRQGLRRHRIASSLFGAPTEESVFCRGLHQWSRRWYRSIDTDISTVDLARLDSLGAAVSIGLAVLLRFDPRSSLPPSLSCDARELRPASQHSLA